MSGTKQVMQDSNYKKNVFISVAFYVATIIANYMSAAGLIAGNSQSEVSKSFPTMITPAGFAFSIWGVIYLFILLALLSPLYTKSELNIKSINAIAPLFWVSCLINIAWTFVFSNKIIWLSAILIVALLISVFMIVLQLKAVRGNEKGLFDIGFGLYAGWLSIASVVNFAAFLVSINFDFWSNAPLFYQVLLVVFVLAVLPLQFVHDNPFYNLAIIWAFFAIIQKMDARNFSFIMFYILAFSMLLLFLVDVKVSYKKMKISL